MTLFTREKQLLSEIYLFWKKINIYTKIFYGIIVFAVIVRVININYNSAFNDEAIYIVVGRMGLFAHDWWSYGAKLWMAGLPYVYPPLAALSYQVGGLVGARLLNVFFGILLVSEVFTLTKLLNLFDQKTNTVAALVASFIAAFSGIGIFVSKLATYDMPSFFLLIASMNLFLKARHHINGRLYFLAFLFLFAAFLTKIVVAIFIPILLGISLLVMKTRSKKHQRMSVIYFYAPFILAIVLYAFFYHDNLMTYVATHKSLGKTESYMTLLSLIWSEANILFLLSVPAAYVFVRAKKYIEGMSLGILALAIPVFHLVLLRLATLDKHVYLTVTFLAVIVGYGISFFLQDKNKLVRAGVVIVSLVALPYFVWSSHDVLYTREHEWTNTVTTQEYLKKNIKPGNKILTEEGGAVILALYDNIFPPKNIVTFDWIDYKGLGNESGYAQAVSDTYFDYVQLDMSTESGSSIRKDIEKHLASNYSLVYKQGALVVYEKNKN